MENIIDSYNPKILIFTNGTIQDNILNIMTIYIINLEDDIDRRNYIIFTMRKIKINYNLVIVKKITDSIYESAKIHTILNKNKLGCAISHLYCIKKGINSGSDKFIIFEDDIIFHKNFSNMFTKDILNLNFDMLMFGASDFNYNYNKQHIIFKSDNLTLYKPFARALGAHANLYTTSFAKKLYNYKISNKIQEFDEDFNKFYGRHSNIYICNPNLVVCELSTTNLNHYFGFGSKNFERYITSIFDECFSYKDYNYITINFINYAKQMQENLSLKNLVELYINTINEDNNYKDMIYDSLLCSNFTIEDIKQINSILINYENQII